MHWKECLDCFHFDHDLSRNEQVDTVSALHTEPLVFNMKLKLSVKRNTPQSKLSAQAFLVGRLKEAGPECPMNRDRGADHSLGYSIRRYASVVSVCQSSAPVVVHH